MAIIAAIILLSCIITFFIHLYIDEEIRWRLMRGKIYSIPFPSPKNGKGGFYIIDKSWIPWFEANCGKRHKNWDIKFKFDHDQNVVLLKLKNKDILPWFILVNDNFEI